MLTQLRWSDIVALDKEVEAEPRARNFEEARAWQALEEEVNRVWRLHDEVLITNNGDACI